MRVVAVRTGHLPFSKRHVGRAIQSALFLQMALGANLYHRSLLVKVSLVSHLRKLKPVAGLLHDGVTGGTRKAPPRMCAGLPVGPISTLVALEAGLVHQLGRLSRIFAERDKSSYTFPPSGGHVVASRTMAGFTALLFKMVPRIKEEDLPHECL